MKNIFFVLCLMSSSVLLASTGIENSFPELAVSQDRKTLSISYKNNITSVNIADVKGKVSATGEICVASEVLYEDLETFYKEFFGNQNIVNHNFIKEGYEGTEKTIPLPQNTYFIYDGPSPLRSSISTANVADCVFAYFYSKKTNRIAAGHFDFTLGQAEIENFINVFCNGEKDSSDIVCRLVSSYVSPLLGKFYLGALDQGVSNIKINVYSQYNHSDDLIFMTQNDHYERSFITNKDISVIGKTWCDIVVDKDHNMFSFSDRYAQRMDDYRNFLFAGKFYNREDIAEVNSSFVNNNTHAQDILNKINSSEIGQKYLNEYSFNAKKAGMSTLINLSDVVNIEENLTEKKKRSLKKAERKAKQEARKKSERKAKKEARKKAERKTKKRSAKFVNNYSYHQPVSPQPYYNDYQRSQFDYAPTYNNQQPYYSDYQRSQFDYAPTYGHQQSYYYNNQQPRSQFGFKY